MLTLTMNCYRQQRYVTTGTNISANVDTVRIDSKQLLTLLEKELSRKFPQGAQLKVATDGKVWVTDSKAVPITEVSAYLNATLDDGVRLLNGQRNLATGQENTRSYYPITLTFNFSTLQGSVKGILMENLVVGSPDRYGFHIGTEKSAGTVNGSGSYNGNPAYFDGSLKLQGKATQ